MNFRQAVKTIGLVQISKLLRSTFATIIFIIIIFAFFPDLTSQTVPRIFIFLFAALVIGTNIVTILNILKMNGGPRFEVPSESIKSQDLQHANEEVIETIVGIIKRGKISYRTNPGIQYDSNPENVILLTKSRLLFLAIPVTGEGKTMIGVDLSAANSVLNQGEIKKTLGAIIERMTPHQMLISRKQNFEILLADIESITTTPEIMPIVKIETRKKSFWYVFSSSMDAEKLKSFAEVYIPGKFHIN